MDYKKPTIFSRQDRVNKPLFVVTPIFNPIRYRTRWRLYEDFAKRVAEAGAILYTIEAAFGSRAFVVTQPNNPRHIQVRTGHELWIKENLINLAVARLPADWAYVAWCDADVEFVRNDWADETVHQLQHYKVLQMFKEAVDMGPNHEMLTRFMGFIWSYQNKVMVPKRGDGYYIRAAAMRGEKKGFYHPGFCWAFRRSAWNQLGGMPDWAILGGGDLYAARALTGIDRTLPKSLGQSGKRWLKEWQRRADMFIKQDVGFMDGTIMHHWHGRKTLRKYLDRGQILVDAKFEPDVDLYRDWQGLYQLRPENVALRDGVRAYFRQRNEDGVDL